MQPCYLSLHEAASRGAFETALVRFAKQLGFDTVSATVVLDRAEGRPDFISAHNTPAAYLAIFEDQSMSRTDPVMQHCKKSGLPITWDQSTYVQNGCTPQWERQAQFGYHCGISVALHLPHGRHLLIGVDRDQPLPADAAEITRMSASLQLGAAYAHEAAARLLVPPIPHENDGATLTPRELECLRWTMEGKTAWEVGRILGVAEQTAVRHLYNATRKLECSGKHHAVIRALRLGLIW